MSASNPHGDVELCVLERSPTERLAILWREYEGHRFLDLRIQFMTPEGKWLPTKKGITVKLRELWNASDAIAKACSLAKDLPR